MSAYNPFDKELDVLEAADLGALRSVSEGWYVEYKRELPSASSIAKSVSAFANTYGGWIFYGISESSREDATAGGFVGIERQFVDTANQRIRQAVANGMNPAAHFEIRAIWGPSVEIGLREDRAIVCVQVPWSPNAPHVHRSGHIYRRVADGSEPRPEHDRFVLDQLFRRSEGVRKDVKNWVKRDPEFSQGESERPYLRLLLGVDLWGDRGAWCSIDGAQIEEILRRSSGTIGAIPFDTVYTTAGGFVGRQVVGNDPHSLTLTWKFRRRLISDIFIPLNVFGPSHPSSLTGALAGYQFAGRFAEILQRQGHRNPKVTDLNYLFNTLSAIVEVNRSLLAASGWTDSFFAKARLLNVWRTVPFIDDAQVLDRFDLMGTPMCLESKVTAPPGWDPESFAEVRTFEEAPNESARILLQAWSIFDPIAQAYGIPSWIDNPDTDRLYLQDLQAAGHRAMEAQRLRNESSR